MRGTLIKSKSGNWEVDGLPVFPNSLTATEAVEGTVVNYEVEEFWETGLEEPIQCAQIQPKTGYPELEGTLALCDEMIKDREQRKQELNKIVKLAEEQWVECDGCNDNDRYFWIKGFHAGRASVETSEISDDTLNFVKWIAANWIPLHVTKEYLWEYDELDISKIPQNYRGYKTEKQLYSLYLEHLKSKS
jgi:hypothetical protein